MTVRPRKRGANHSSIPQADRINSIDLKQRVKDGEDMSLRNPDRPLTEKQKKFAVEWAHGESVYSASVRAGYADNGKSSYIMTKDPAILKIYHREKALYEASCQMTRKKVMDGFLEAADMARTLADPVALTGAFRELGKMAGYYEPVKRTLDINISGDVTMKKLECMSDADLLKLVKGDVEDAVFEMVEVEDDAATE